MRLHDSGGVANAFGRLLQGERRNLPAARIMKVDLADLLQLRGATTVAGKLSMIALIAAGCLAACCFAGRMNFAKADQPYPEDAERGMDLSGGRDARPGWSSRATGDEAVQQDLDRVSDAFRRADARGGSKTRAANKTAAQASTQGDDNPALASISWRRAFGPLLSWWMWCVPAALAIAAVAWITSLVVRRRSSRGVPPLVVFGADGAGVAPARREGERRSARRDNLQTSQGCAKVLFSGSKSVMKTIYERLQMLKPRDLRRLSEAIDIELRRRMEARKAGPNADREDELPVLPLPLASRSPGPRRAA